MSELGQIFFFWSESPKSNPLPVPLGYVNMHNSMNFPVVDNSLIRERRTLKGILPFSIVEIPSFHQGVVTKNGTPISVLQSAKYCFVARPGLLSRYELWIVNTKTNHFAIDKGVCVTQDGWRVEIKLTVTLHVADPRQLIPHDNPIYLLREQLFSILQSQVKHYTYQLLGQFLGEIGRAVLSEGNIFASNLGLRLNETACTWKPGERDPRYVASEVEMRQAGALSIGTFPPLLLQQANQCLNCQTPNRRSARFCSSCGRQL